MITKIITAKCIDCVFSFLNTQINMYVCLNFNNLEVYGKKMSIQHSKECNCDNFIFYKKPEIPQLTYTPENPNWTKTEYEEY